LCAAHFGEGKQESKCRLRALILVYPVDMQAIPAAPTLSIIECKTEIIAAVKPFECLAGMREPIAIARGFMSLKTSAYHGVGLYGLLIEPRGVPNTGDRGGERTAPNDLWI
jgi:hypothetical protein